MIVFDRVLLLCAGVPFGARRNTLSEHFHWSYKHFMCSMLKVTDVHLFDSCRDKRFKVIIDHRCSIHTSALESKPTRFGDQNTLMDRS